VFAFAIRYPRLSVLMEVYLKYQIIGPILFAVLVNSLLRDWNFRIKFVDDLTTIEFIPRCSLSVTPLLVNVGAILKYSLGIFPEYS
jgi:hypothetical protein